MVTRRSWRAAATSLAGTLALVACSGGGSADVATLPVASAVVTGPGASSGGPSSTPMPGATEVATTDDMTTDVTATGADATAADATDAVTIALDPATTAGSSGDETGPTALPDGFVGLSPDGPWHLVDSAPGVDSPGLVYELMPKLWAFLPTEAVPDDGNLFVPQPQDIPIIEAYLQAKLVYFRAVTQNPIDLDDPGWSEFFTDGGAAYREVLEPKQAQGQHVDLDIGVVLRPYVLGDGRSDAHAIVFDCVLDGAVFVLPAGELAPGSTRGVGSHGQGIDVAHDGTMWVVARIARQEEACV